jgi:zona occludens toxin
MIVLKTGVPGSGKTLSMVAELQALQEASDKGADPRPIYTNITGLALKHIPLLNWEPNTVRVPGVLYTIDWRECPVGSIVVIDECFLYGYDAKSAQSTVPDYIRDLAIHRKDYSLDIYFICQHPKLMHVAARRQVGKHQHYRRLFGWGRAVCYEWDSAQDNLAQTKTAVMTQFSYPAKVFKAYHSAESHNKPKFKLPWWVWIPVGLVPLAAWAIPAAVGTLGGAMTGKGLVSSNPAAVASGVIPPAPVLSAVVALPATTSPVELPQLVPEKKIAAGCIVFNKRCGCFDSVGQPIEVESGFCESKTSQGSGKPIEFPDDPQPRVLTDADLDAYRFAFLKR